MFFCIPEVLGFNVCVGACVLEEQIVLLNFIFILKKGGRFNRKNGTKFVVHFMAGNYFTPTLLLGKSKQ